MSNKNRFHWRTWIVEPNKVDDALKSTDLETYEIHGIHVLPPDPANEHTRVMIVGKQALAIGATLNAIRSTPNVQGFPFPDKHDALVPHDGIYMSSCGHIGKAEYSKGAAFDDCPKCNRAVQWKLVDLS